MTYVYNAKNTSDDRCNCTSWLEHWQKYSGRKAVKCSNENCCNEPTLGGHIYVAGGDRIMFIVPLCDQCNHTDNFLNIGHVKLVLASNMSSCGK